MEKQNKAVTVVTCVGLFIGSVVVLAFWLVSLVLGLFKGSKTKIKIKPKQNIKVTPGVPTLMSQLNESWRK
ncbi:MAG: hypothetical protein LBM13_02525 [Candidatus Ancillula sp.]|jgi:FlaG/FlaF family flagellin (archaellin)|nr:hypothetical protein [Candidatus Ancillula sp.]